MQRYCLINFHLVDYDSALRAFLDKKDNISIPIVGAYDDSAITELSEVVKMQIVRQVSRARAWDSIVLDMNYAAKMGSSERD